MNIDCPECGKKLGPEKTFNLLFPVEMGASSGDTTKAYLRGETAQGMFVNFKNVLKDFKETVVAVCVRRFEEANASGSDRLAKLEKVG